MVGLSQFHILSDTYLSGCDLSFVDGFVFCPAIARKARGWPEETSLFALQRMI